MLWYASTGDLSYSLHWLWCLCFTMQWLIKIIIIFFYSQYFLWYLCLLPLILDSVNITFRRAAVLVIAWFTSQVMFFLLISCGLALTFEKYYILVGPVASVIFCHSSWGHTLLIISNICLFFFNCSFDCSWLLIFSFCRVFGLLLHTSWNLREWTLFYLFGLPVLFSSLLTFRY